MVGCFASHLGIWKEMVDKKIPCLIVMEDDVIPYDDFKARIGQLQGDLQALEDGWDVCLLGAVGCIQSDNEPWFMRFYELGPGGGRPAPKGSSTRTVSEHLYAPHRPAGTHAYMISYSGAKKLLETFPKAAYHVDLAAWGLKSLKLLAAKPFLATQRFDEAASTVAKKGSRTEVAMRWVLEATGVSRMTRIAGANPSWAWRCPLFLLPLPFRRWPNHGLTISMGPFTSVLMLLWAAGIFRRSPVWLGIGFAYMCVMSTFVRFMAKTINLRVFVAEAGAAAALLCWGLLGGGPVRL